MQAMGESHSVSQLLIEQLTPRVYNELHKLARAYLRRGRLNQSLQPVQWENRAHFFGIAGTTRHVGAPHERQPMAAD